LNSAIPTGGGKSEGGVFRFKKKGDFTKPKGNSAIEWGGNRKNTETEKVLWNSTLLPPRKRGDFPISQGEKNLGGGGRPRGRPQSQGEKWELVEEKGKNTTQEEEGLSPQGRRKKGEAKKDVQIF